MIEELSRETVGEDLLRVFGYSTWMPTSQKTSKRVRAQFSNNAVRILVCRKDGNIVGCIAYEMAGHRMTVNNIAVEIGYRNRGTGRALIAEAIRRARPRSVELECGYEARGFYEKLGFKASSVVRAEGETGRYRCSLSVCAHHPIVDGVHSLMALLRQAERDIAEERFPEAAALFSAREEAQAT